MATRTREHRSFPKIDGFVAWVAQASQHLRALIPGPAGKRLFRLRDALARSTQREISDADFIEEYAQAVACGRVATRLSYQPTTRPATPLADVANPFVAASLAEAIAAWPPAAENESELVIARNGADLAQLYEPFLGQHHQQRRSRHGVYYTPGEIATYIVTRVDALLRTEFDLPDGLADQATWADVLTRHPALKIPERTSPHEPFVRILDPAVGGGVFLVAVIDVIWETMCDKWKSASWTDDQIQQAWQAYVPRHLLPRLCGLELMLPAAVVAHWQVVEALAKTGYRFQGDERIRIFLVDTLADWPQVDRRSVADPTEFDAARNACRGEACTVVLGNPPFSGISRNNGGWISELLRGRTEDGQQTASYFQANGAPLAERKHWLQDDYVKFMRYAQWRIETAGVGIVGFVTNHGYLDNVTFRGMREQLLAAFPRIAVLDFHGSAKKKEVAPDGKPDENVFGIESGIAVGLFRKPLTVVSPWVEFSELWGSRDAKLERLATGRVPGRRVTPMAPYHFLTPGGDDFAGEYEQATPLTEIMPVNSTAAVTARDSFVVAFERRELLDRMAIFRDLTISDDHIRAKFFSNSRSRRYLPGDTRGWQLTEARQRMANDPNWQSHVRPCLYRPYDQRWIYWTDWMIDWPRDEVNQHMTTIDNLSLIARRQMLPTRPCNFFWVSRTIPIDGVIRSDNRGSESFFPLFLHDVTADAQHRLAVNFAAPFLATLVRSIQLEWRTDRCRTDEGTFGPRDLFYYIYAQFHSTEYRQRFAAWLRIEFPRVFVPRKAETFWELSRLGEALVEAHTSTETAGDETQDSPAKTEHLDAVANPRHIRNRIQLGERFAIDNVASDVWEFYVGGHQVCRKWWRDRRGRTPTAADIASYCKIVDGVRTTLHVVGKIDRWIESHGGWLGAFVGRQSSRTNG